MMRTMIQSCHRRWAGRPGLSRGQRQAAGFTMVELLITMLLLTVVLTGLAALQLTTIRQVTAGRQAAEATRLAQSLVERHRSMSITQVAALSPVDEWFTLLQTDGVTEMRDVSVTGAGTGPFTAQRLVERQVINTITYHVITIRVSWRDVVPGVRTTEGQRFRTRDVMMSCRRAL